MNPVLVLYATREGHTQRIAEHVGATLRARGMPATVENVRDLGKPFALDPYAAVVLAASVHGGRHEREMVAFVRNHRAELERRPNAFLSVSLSEAGVEKQDAPPERRERAHAEVAGMIERFFAETGWQPERVRPIAGALLYTQYGRLLRFVMKRISNAAGGDTDTSRDHVYTDWEALERFVEELAEEIRDRK